MHKSRLTRANTQPETCIDQRDEAGCRSPMARLSRCSSPVRPSFRLHLCLFLSHLFSLCLFYLVLLPGRLSFFTLFSFLSSLSSSSISLAFFLSLSLFHFRLFCRCLFSFVLLPGRLFFFFFPFLSLLFSSPITFFPPPFVSLF